MLRTDFQIEIIEDGTVVDTRQFHNLVLDTGLKLLITGGFTWGSGGTSILVGSSDDDPDKSQTGLIELMGGSNQAYTMELKYGPDDDKYAYVEVVRTFSRHELNGLWAEVGIGSQGNLFNRALIKTPGTLEPADFEYAVSSVNATGESPLSAISQASVTASNSSVRIDWDPPADTSVNSKTPSKYRVYRKDGGVFKRIAETMATRKHFYDRGEVLPGLSHSTTSLFLEQPLNVSSVATDQNTPKSFTKHDLQEVTLTFQLYLSNKDSVVYAL